MELELKPSLRSESGDVMTFLNEVAGRYPQAVPLAAGRPLERFLDLGSLQQHIERYVEHAAATTGSTVAQVRARLGQYGRTNGIIGDLIARHLEVDEGISVDAESIVVTHGAQEAMSIVLQGLFEPGRDVLLVSDPNYIGITGAARILGIEIEPVRCGEQGLDLDDLAEAIRRVRARGRTAKAIYDIPDFHNPQGTSMPLDARRRLLELAKAESLFVLEDNPYGMFAYDGPRLPTLKSLDRDRQVIYLGTFSKTLYPALRVGYLVADQRAARGSVAQELALVKGLVTVNTSTICQAIVGGYLLEHGCSLVAPNAAKVDFYRNNRDHMLAALQRELGGVVPGWNRPSGGFFISVDLPFECQEPDVAVSAERYGVLWCPMSFFALGPGHARKLRLSFSYVDPPRIDDGVARLARFIRDKLADSTQR